MNIREQIHELKKSLKQTIQLIKIGMPYYTAAHSHDMSNKPVYQQAKKNLLWIGPFPGRHRNVGDHAQTVAVKRFLKKYFSDYHVIRLDRNEVKKQKEQIVQLANSFNKNDIVFLHSSGDFGSQHYDPNGCWHLTRREIASRFSKSKVFNLPTTVMYSQDESAQKLLLEDKKIFSSPNFSLFCREHVSHGYVKDVFTSHTQFLPDFVFYLQRSAKPHAKRNGAIVILRSDSEASFDEQARNELVKSLKTYFTKVDVSDILNADFPVVKSVEEKYVEHIQDVYEQYELVITDRMHGMILAVTTNTPCLALDSGIPHKINAYKAFLDGAVTFYSDRDFNAQLFKKVIDERTPSPDLSHYYSEFRSNFID